MTAAPIRTVGHQPIDSRVHHALLGGIVARGFAPDKVAIAATLGVPAEEVGASLLRLADNHGLVLHPGTDEVWLAHPFALSPAAVWVDAGPLGWWAPCLWCAFGIVALAAPSATLHTRIGGEREPLVIEVRDGRLVGDGPLVHFTLPPRRAWDNVVHWCACVLPFRAESAVAQWCSRHAMQEGAIVPAAQVLELGRAWYGRHLAADWRKWTSVEARAIFESVGLTGDFWALPAAERF